MRKAFRVTGRVQGVFYRASAAEAASGRGLLGWVRNRADGNVEGVVEGPDDAVEAFLGWCQKGPPSARVDELVVTDDESGKALASFHVVRDA